MKVALVGALAMVVAPALAAEPLACSGRDLSGAPGVAEAKARRADDLLNGEGLLWRVEKPGLPTSWLFGTIHSTDPEALALARRAAGKLAGVRVMAAELPPMDATAKANLSATLLAQAVDKDRDTLEVVPEADRESLDALTAATGYPVPFVHHLKPWFVAILISTPSCETKREAAGLPEVDEFLMAEAKDAGLRVVGLETAQEQMDAISSIDPAVAGALLAVAGRNASLNDDVYETTVRLYLAERPADVVAVGDVVGDMSPSEREAQDAFTRQLLVKRNATMIERAEPLLQEGAFIAVGALHLPGKDGLIERLRRADYNVTKEW